MNDKGRLLITTRSKSVALKVCSCIACYICISGGIICLSQPEEMLRDIRSFGRFGYDHPQLIAYLLVIICFILGILALRVGFIDTRSHCDVYEKGVSGLTKIAFNHPMQKFELRYDEIKNVTEAGILIRLFTAYATYDVWALRNRAEAIREIRSRMKK